MMFKKSYALRRYGEQEITNGYASAPYEDISVRLNVQPLPAKELEALPEGKRSGHWLKAFGTFPVRTADQQMGTPADRLWYRGRWYECEGADNWDHTPLAHFESQWVAVPESAAQEPPPQEGGQTDDGTGAENRVI